MLVRTTLTGVWRFRMKGEPAQKHRGQCGPHSPTCGHGPSVVKTSGFLLTGLVGRPKEVTGNSSLDQYSAVVLPLGLLPFIPPRF